MLEKDPYGLGMPPSTADFLIKPDEEIELEGIKIKFIISRVIHLDVQQFK